MHPVSIGVRGVNKVFSNEFRASGDLDYLGLFLLFLKVLKRLQLLQSLRKMLPNYFTVRLQKCVFLQNFT